MTGNDLRQRFIDYFVKHGHQAVSSSPLVPKNDPTILFTNAGMNQFKDCFLGAEKRSYTRAVTSQKCLRISGKHNDLENVGRTARHHTFFEMLGNFSFGDYFKADAIKFAWELITKELALDKGRLWVTVFRDDDEAAKLWHELCGVPTDRILRCGEKDNFWAMGDVGPCGPCSEIHYYIGDKPDSQSEAGFRAEDGSYLEIWNLVFMQFDRAKDGKLVPLPKPAIDTGMGLERIASIVQGGKANYDSDLLRPIISEVEKITRIRYDGRSYIERSLESDRQYAADIAMRVIADHTRATSAMIADGVIPGSDGREYVLRRLIRRAVRWGRQVGLTEPFLDKTAKIFIKHFQGAYPELVENQDHILKVLTAEEGRFQQTIGEGLIVLEDAVKKLAGAKVLPGDLAFLLYDTYGFPLDLTEDWLRAKNMSVDTVAFEKAMQEQRSRSREERKGQGLAYTATKVGSPKTRFLGYNELEVEAKLLEILPEQDGALLAFDATSFYAESGGQVGDIGEIKIKDQHFQVIDTQKHPSGVFLHKVNGAVDAKLIGSIGKLSVDGVNRAKIAANHSATHILHAGLRKLLGSHVKQAGSLVGPAMLRFDFSHFESLSPAILKELHYYMLEQVASSHTVHIEEMPIDKARSLGAMALFGEKYGDVVRVVRIGSDSIELCGGTHVNQSSLVGPILILSEAGIAAGVRRIECRSHLGAIDQAVAWRSYLESAATLLGGDITAITEKIEGLTSKVATLEAQLASTEGVIASMLADQLIKERKPGSKYITGHLPTYSTTTLKIVVDAIKNKLPSSVVFLSGKENGKLSFVAGVTKDLTAKISAGKLVQSAAAASGGRGGGRPDFAQGGGGDINMLSQSISAVTNLIGEL